MDRLGSPRGCAALGLSGETQCSSPGAPRTGAGHLTVQDRIASAESLDLLVRQLDVAYPVAHRRARNADGPRDFLDRLSLLATQGAGLVALPYLHRYEQAYVPLRTEAGGGNRTRVLWV